MKKIIGLLALTILLSVIFPPDTHAAQGDVEFDIRFFDRRIYYAEGDPILIQVTITNNSPSTYRFKLAEERVFSLDFDVRTLTNRLLEPADTLLRKRTQYQQIYFREIALETGESFSFEEDLRDYVKLSEAGSFVVKASVYPELIRSNNAAQILESRRLNLSIRPQVIPGPDGIPLEMDVATGAVLVRERLAPDRVVDYMLTARQRSQWERFFLYLDLEAMLSQDAARRREWLAESEEGRRRMVEKYREELRNSTIDGTISVNPTDYVIERTQYSNFEGDVSVLQKYKSSNGNFTELKRYTYHLRLRDNIWTIVSYSVINLGTE